MAIHVVLFKDVLTEVALRADVVIQSCPFLLCRTYLKPEAEIGVGNWGQSRFPRFSGKALVLSGGGPNRL